MKWRPRSITVAYPLGGKEYGNVCFQCEGALAVYREFKSRGIQPRTRPFVGNRLWVEPVTDPDGCRMEFSSPTDAPEETELEA